MGRLGLRHRTERAGNPLLRRVGWPEMSVAFFSSSKINWEDFAAPRTSGITEFFEPNLYLYDAYPGGIGFSEPLYRISNLLLERTRELISACPCENGCPSCVGPAADRSERTKNVALAMLERLCALAQEI